MDYSKYPLGTEGCSSSESGWTMYIDTPMQEDDIECYNEEDGDDSNDRKSNYNCGIHGGYNKEDSDDSMVSDASSAPSHHQYKHANAESSHAMGSYKHGKKSGKFKKLFSWKKSNEKEKQSVEHSSKHIHKNDAHNKKKYIR